MTTLNTVYGIIQKVNVNNKITYILPIGLTSKKLISLKKKFKEFFSDYQVITITKEQKEKAKKLEFFKPLFASLPLTITKIVPEKTIFFMAGIILAFVLVSFLITMYVEYRKKQKETVKISFNSHSNNY